MEIRQAILTAAAAPAIARALTVAGSLGIVTEFLRPGAVWPGAAGAVLLLLGFPGTPLNPALIVPFAIVGSALLTIAWRARRNKKTTATLLKGNSPS